MTPDLTLADVAALLRLSPEYAARVLKDRETRAGHYSRRTHDRLPPMRKEGGRWLIRANTFAAWRSRTDRPRFSARPFTGAAFI